jgi:nanoRNase/pAp phosphatase (c-di-AMP/oligoRNAs hydrolase)
MPDLGTLFSTLKARERVFIQTHDFPDHDAIASAFGMQKLLESRSIPSRIVYCGELQRDSLVETIRSLGIVALPSAAAPMSLRDAIVIVDGCKGNKNVTDLPGDEVAIIDHHQVKSPEDVPWSDVRAAYGACSTIVFSYFAETATPLPREAATALLIGINMDTALLTRGVSQSDISAYSKLYSLANVPLVNSILRNFIQQKDLDFYRRAIQGVRISDSLAFCYFPEGCNQNMLGILGDFFLALKEVKFVALCAKNDGKINFSLRSEEPSWNCNLVIQKVLAGRGFGGGHADMAGGIIPDAALFDPEGTFRLFQEALA